MQIYAQLRRRFHVAKANERSCCLYIAHTADPTSITNFVMQQPRNLPFYSIPRREQECVITVLFNYYSFSSIFPIFWEIDFITDIDSSGNTALLCINSSNIPAKFFKALQYKLSI